MPSVTVCTRLSSHCIKNTSREATFFGNVLFSSSSQRSATHRKVRSLNHAPSIFASAIEETEPPENVSDKAWTERVYVHEIMTPSPVSVTPDTPVFTALEILSERDISGIPVVEKTGEVVGVVSAYDILALDSTPGQLDKSDGFFPRLGKCDADFGGDVKAMWRSFFSLRNGIMKAHASKVGESMHDAYCVSKRDSLSTVADVMVRCNTQRTFVLDDEGQLCGVVSRGDILRVTMKKYREIREEDQ